MVSLRKLGDDGHGVLVEVDPQTRGLIQRAAAKFRRMPTEAARDELKTLVDSLMDLPTCTAADRYDAQIAASKVAEKKRQARIKSVQSTGSSRKRKKKSAAEVEEFEIVETETVVEAEIADETVTEEE